MHIYRLHLTLQDPLYFATRELGRLYVTERYLHNYALSYALEFVQNSYHDAEHVPHYQGDLEPLNGQGIYVTPARPIESDYVTHTYKWANLHYHVEMEQQDKNMPTFGRIRELAPESSFEVFLLAKKAISIPSWIRLGKWRSKLKVEIKELAEAKHNQAQEFICFHPLNPLDVMFTNQVLSYDTVNMPPVSLIRNVRMVGEYYSFDELPDLKLPARMQYRFGG